jgi:hypothetical protein
MLIFCKILKKFLKFKTLILTHTGKHIVRFAQANANAKTCQRACLFSYADFSCPEKTKSLPTHKPKTKKYCNFDRAFRLVKFVRLDTKDKNARIANRVDCPTSKD